ncbi:MAG TPA: histone deacetylase [Polyangiaceae bacterium]
MPENSRIPRPPSEGPRSLLVDDPAFDQHRPRAYHPERPERLRAARSAIARTPATWVPVPVREARTEELLRVHDEAFVNHLESLRGTEGNLDPDTYYGVDSVRAARRAAGGVLAMVEAMIDGPVRTGVALPRPPGHHARPDRAMGFCLLNNVAVAAAHARAMGVERVAIVDFDVHHGNGTQEMFYADPAVLYASLHQFPFYPGTGPAEEIGGGEGRGATVNVPLGSGGGDDVYRAAFERVILPVLEQFRPGLVLVSAGFDASARDPLAEMTLSGQAFGYMAQELAKVAARSAEGRLGLVLEGGYDLVALEEGLGAALSGALGFARFDPERDADHPDVARAAREAARSWKVA